MTERPHLDPPLREQRTGARLCPLLAAASTPRRARCRAHTIRWMPRADAAPCGSHASFVRCAGPCKFVPRPAPGNCTVSRCARSCAPLTQRMRDRRAGAAPLSARHWWCAWWRGLRARSRSSMRATRRASPRRATWASTTCTSCRSGRAPFATPRRGAARLSRALSPPACHPYARQLFGRRARSAAPLGGGSCLIVARRT